MCARTPARARVIVNDAYGARGVMYHYDNTELKVSVDDDDIQGYYNVSSLNVTLFHLFHSHINQSRRVFIYSMLLQCICLLAERVWVGLAIAIWCYCYSMHSKYGNEVAYFLLFC